MRLIGIADNFSSGGTAARWRCASAISARGTKPPRPRVGEKDVNLIGFLARHLVGSIEVGNASSHATCAPAYLLTLRAVAWRSAFAFPVSHS